MTTTDHDKLNIVYVKNPKLYYIEATDHSVRRTGHMEIEEFEAEIVSIEITGWLIAEDDIYYHFTWSRLKGSRDKQYGFKTKYSDHWLVPKATVTKKKRLKT